MRSRQVLKVLAVIMSPAVLYTCDNTIQYSCENVHLSFSERVVYWQNLWIMFHKARPHFTKGSLWQLQIDGLYHIRICVHIIRCVKRICKNPSVINRRTGRAAAPRCAALWEPRCFKQMFHTRKMLKLRNDCCSLALGKKNVVINVSLFSMTL